MKKLCRNLFCFEKDSKITEYIINIRIVFSIGVITLCLAAMSFTAYAYYAYSIASSNNMIRSGSFDVVASAWVGDPSGEAVAVVANGERTYQATLLGNNTYYLTIQVTPESTATGFVIVEIGNGYATYHTQPLRNAENEISNTISFCITTSETVDVIFRANWGTSSMYGYHNENNPLYIVQDTTVTLSNPSNNNEMEQNTVTETSAASEATEPIQTTAPQETTMPEVPTAVTEQSSTEETSQPEI